MRPPRHPETRGPASSPPTRSCRTRATGRGEGRTSYVRNNPLNATDPSGYFLNKAFKGLFRAIGSIPVIGDAMRFVATNQYLSSMVSIAVGVLTAGSGAVLTLAMVAQNAAIAAGTQVAMVGMAGGGLGDALKSGAIAAASVAAFSGIHAIKDGALGATLQGFAKDTAGSALLHGTVGGTMSVAQGGKFHSGFLAGGFGDLAGSIGHKELGFSDNPSTPQLAKQTAFSAVVGGAASALGGGKFGNGAITGAFGYLFNQMAGGFTPQDMAGVELGEKHLDGVFALPAGDSVSIEGKAGVGSVGRLGGELSNEGLSAIGGVEYGAGAHLRIDPGFDREIFTLGDPLPDANVALIGGLEVGVGVNLRINAYYAPFNPGSPLGLQFSAGPGGLGAVISGGMYGKAPVPLP